MSKKRSKIGIPTLVKDNAKVQDFPSSDIPSLRAPLRLQSFKTTTSNESLVHRRLGNPYMFISFAIYMTTIPKSSDCSGGISRLEDLDAHTASWLTTGFSCSSSRSADSSDLRSVIGPSTRSRTSSASPSKRPLQYISQRWLLPPYLSG